MPELAELQLNFFAEVEASEKEYKQTVAMIDDLAMVFTRPVIVMPAYRDMPLPDDFNTIAIERLVLAKEGRQIASEAETMWYLSTASLVAPLGREWANIFEWLTRRYLIKTNRTLPSFLDEETTLGQYAESELQRLRRWLYRKSIEAVRERRRYAEAKT